MIELLLLFIAWVDSPEGWQQWIVFTVTSRAEVAIACNNEPDRPLEKRSLGCIYDIPNRWIFLWEPQLDPNPPTQGKWGCHSSLWHELLHAQDNEYERENWHGGSLRMSEMPCKS